MDAIINVLTWLKTNWEIIGGIIVGLLTILTTLRAVTKRKGR